MNRPLLPSGWADDRLRQAFDLIDAVLTETHQEHDAFYHLTKAMTGVEDADCALEKSA